MARSTLSLADDAEIEKRYTWGATTRELADRFAVSEAAIRRALDRRGVARRPVGWPRAEPLVEDHVIVQYRDAGWSWGAVAQLAGMSIHGVRKRYQAAKSERAASCSSS